MTDVFAIILNWNKAELTIDCLRSLIKTRTQNVNLHPVVIDNGSIDNSVEVLKKFSRSLQGVDIKLVINDKNLGFAGGNNVGIKYALEQEADYVLVLNNDTIVDKNLLIHLLKPFKNKRVGVVVPKIYFAEGYEFHKNRYRQKDLGKVIWYAGGNIDWENAFGVNRGVDEVDMGQFNKSVAVNFATGACMMIRADLFKKVGYFDEKYYMYFEDVDLSQKIIEAGFRILYNPNAKIWHKVAQSSAIGSNLNDYYISRNRLYFGLKYAPFRTKAALIKESLRFLLKGRRWQKKGVIDFYLGRFSKGSWKN